VSIRPIVVASSTNDAAREPSGRRLSATEFVSTILFHRSSLLSDLELHHALQEHIADLRRLNQELRTELEVTLEEERQRRAGELPPDKPVSDS
jgi:hypothetical protein